MSDQPRTIAECLHTFRTVAVLHSWEPADYEEICRYLSQKTGEYVDWHFVAGRANIYTTGSDEVRTEVQKAFAYDARFLRRFCRRDQYAKPTQLGMYVESCMRVFTGNTVCLNGPIIEAMEQYRDTGIMCFGASPINLTNWLAFEDEQLKKKADETPKVL